MLESIHEECGLIGIFDMSLKTDVVRSAYYALFALQHRGQESCGIAVNDDGVISVKKSLGLVPEVFNAENLDALGGGCMTLGHVRYSTTRDAQNENSQPLLVHHVKGSMAIAINGNLTNSVEIRESLELTGAIFHSNSDAEVISYNITRARLTEDSIEQAVEKAMYSLKGAYSMIIMSPRKLIAARDPHGLKPLCIGRKNDAVFFASESCALSALGAEFIRDIEPGEIVIAGPNGLKSIKTHCRSINNLCSFEYIYFARSDSVIEGTSVHMARKKAGAMLAREYPVDADVVIGVPDSALDAALGYAEESGIPFGIGFIRNRYIGRTFIMPTQGEREDAVRIKLSVLKSVVDGKRVIIVDDSIVRGTTTKVTMGLVREAGAKEIHMRISSPPFRYPCYFGTDVDSMENLIATRMTEDEIAREIGVDSLGFLSLEGVRSIAGNHDYCVGCFTGEYPVAPPKRQRHKSEIRISENKEMED